MTKITEPYKHILDNWNKKAGRKPTTKQIREALKTGYCRIGAKNTLAIAMALRDGGTTQAQIKAVLGQTHHNKLKALVTKKAVSLVKAANDNGLTNYKLKLKPQKA